jgi:hypothetical protein
MTTKKCNKTESNHQQNQSTLAIGKFISKAKEKICINTMLRALCYSESAILSHLKTTYSTLNISE